MEFRIVGPDDEPLLVELFGHIDETFFRPHPFTPEEARAIARRDGLDVYAVLLDDERPVAYGMLRGFDEGYATPALGIAVRSDVQGKGMGRQMMEALHDAAVERGARMVRLRVHADNGRARRLYESVGYVYRGVERGELVMEVNVPRGTNRRLAAQGITLVRVEEPGWDEAIAGVAHSVFHTAGYHRYTRGFGEGEPYLAVAGDAARGLAWPYILRPVADVKGLEASEATDVQSVYGYPGPLAWGADPGDGFVRDALDAVAETWRRQGAVSAFTRFNPVLGNAAIIPAGAGVIDAAGVTGSGHTVSMDLADDDAAIRAGYGRGLGRDVDQGRRAGLRTVEDDAWVHLARFAELYRGTMARLGAAQFYYFAEGDFQRLRACLGSAAHLLVTLMGDEVAAAGLFLDAGDVVEWHLVGSNDTYRDLSPSKVLVDDAIRWARDRGYRGLHMGGGRGGREDSLFWFKSRFSKRRHPFFVGRWVLDAEAYADLTARRLATLPAHSSPDPGFFPAYRAPVVPEVDGPA